MKRVGAERLHKVLQWQYHVSFPTSLIETEYCSAAPSQECAVLTERKLEGMGLKILRVLPKKLRAVDPKMALALGIQTTWTPLELHQGVHHERGRLEFGRLEAPTPSRLTFGRRTR